MSRNKPKTWHRSKLTGKGLCPKTGKKSWSSEYLANYALQSILMRGRSETLPMRVYECEFCYKFHLTSKPWIDLKTRYGDAYVAHPESKGSES